MSTPMSKARPVLAPLAAAAAVCLVLLGFSWPALVAEPRDLPVAVTGQPELVQELTTMMAAQSGDAFELQQVVDRAAAETAVRERDAVGAIVLDPAHPEMIIASATGTGPSEVMRGIGDSLQQKLTEVSASGEAPPLQLTITDVAPYGSDDPNGSRLAIAGLPLTIGGVLGGALISLAVAGLVRQLVGLVSYAVVAGLGLTAILQYWYGALTADFWINSAVLTLALFGVAGVVIGLRRLIGPAGIGLAAVLFVLGANPISGTMTPREFLPEPWAAIGSWTPQGAGPDLLRGLSFFPDAPTGQPWLVLGCWAAAAWLLITLGRRSAAG